MKVTSNDRRVRRTKKALRGALAKLLMEKELHEITVQELTDLADIHRATFYSHYQDIFELYEQTEDEFLTELSSLLKENPTHNYEELIATLINYVWDNQLMFQMLLGENGNTRFRSKVGKLLEDRYLSICLYETPIDPIPDEWNYLAGYHIHGCMNMIGEWIQSGFTEPSKKELVKLIYLLDSRFDEILDLYIK